MAKGKGRGGKPSPWYEPGLIPQDVCKARVGALQELRVCADLIFRGYHVFRNVSASGPCDLVALKNGRLHRVEVTTGRRAVKPGGVAAHRKKDPTKHDLLAVVFHDGEIAYTPTPEEL